MFVGHFENHVLDIYCYDVNIVLIGAGLTTCKFGCTFDSRALVWLLQICFSIEAGGSAILRDTGVIVWKWPCVLPLVTCLRVMVTSHCWPFLYNYPCYLSNWHCLSLALTVEALNAWCAWWWLCFLSLCSCVISHSFTQTDKRECVFFFFLLVVELYDQIIEVCFVFTRSFPFFLSFFPCILCTSEITDFFWHLDLPPQSTSGVTIAYPWFGENVP